MHWASLSLLLSSPSSSSSLYLWRPAMIIENIRVESFVPLGLLASKDQQILSSPVPLSSWWLNDDHDMVMMLMIMVRWQWRWWWSNVKTCSCQASLGTVDCHCSVAKPLSSSWCCRSSSSSPLQWSSRSSSSPLDYNDHDGNFDHSFLLVSLPGSRHTKHVWPVDKSLYKIFDIIWDILYCMRS